MGLVILIHMVSLYRLSSHQQQRRDSQLLFSWSSEPCYGSGNSHSGPTLRIKEDLFSPPWHSWILILHSFPEFLPILHPRKDPSLIIPWKAASTREAAHTDLYSITERSLHPSLHSWLRDTNTNLTSIIYIFIIFQLSESLLQNPMPCNLIQECPLSRPYSACIHVHDSGEITSSAPCFPSTRQWDYYGTSYKVTWALSVEWVIVYKSLLNIFDTLTSFCLLDLFAE